MEQLVPIGQFAALTRLSPKALRLYDENGLLRPARVDPDSGYRYYRLDQLAHGRLIRLLRAVEMPLTEIAAFLRTLGSAPLDAYVARVAAREADRDRVLRYVRRLGGEEKCVMSFQVAVKKVAAQP